MHSSCRVLPFLPRRRSSDVRVLAGVLPMARPFVYENYANFLVWRWVTHLSQHFAATEVLAHIPISLVLPEASFHSRCGGFHRPRFRPTVVIHKYGLNTRVNALRHCSCANTVSMDDGEMHHRGLL